MDITLSLQNALTGLQAAQANLAIISSNITNAQTPGYSREIVPLSTQIVGNAGAGVLVGLTQRQVDENLAKSARQQDTAASAATTTNSYLQQIQSLFGQVNSGDSLGDVFNKLSQRDELAGFEITTRFFEVGSPGGLIEFAQYLRESARTNLWDSQN